MSARGRIERELRQRQRDEDFRQRYRITAPRSGIIYGRRKLISYAMADMRRGLLSSWPAPRRRAFAERFVDDEQWMTRRTGQTPQSIAIDIWYAAAAEYGRELS